MSKINPLNSVSYTNRDFQKIFPEQLELAKKLSYRWDPSQSNESDPGVVLLKENAIIADKNNYQIDKSVLELSPATVTHEGNARQLFDQLGYQMRWYRSSTTVITLKWIGDGDGFVKISPFTMVTDSDSNIIYTLLGMINSTEVNTVSGTNIDMSQFISDIILPTNGDVIQVVGIQGIVSRYQFLNDYLITLDKLDTNNRLYINEFNVAENGIFICSAHIDQSSDVMNNFTTWKQVENLSIVPTTDKAYKFGVDSNNNSCYIEFPENIADLIGTGLHMYYIVSDGSQGNIIVNQLEQFYGGPSASIISTTGSLNQNAVLSSDTVAITNPFATSNGFDPETISEAFRNYKRTVGTFNTLVSLRDYQNAIKSSNLVSNAFVTDRSCDIQCSYQVVSQLTASSDRVTREVLANRETPTSLLKPEMTAYDLKIYPLYYINEVKNREDYENSFYLDSSEITKNIIVDYISDKSCIQHDFLSLPLTPKNVDTQDRNNTVFFDAKMFVNEYPINCKITPKYTLSILEQQELQENVRTALYKNLNSKEIEFGEAPSYDIIYDIIMNSDSRINNLFLDDLTYTTYFIHASTDASNTHDLKLPLLLQNAKNLSEDEEKFIQQTQRQVLARSILSGKTPLYNISNNFDFAINQQQEVFAKSISSINSYYDLVFKPTTTFVDDYPSYQANLKENEYLRLSAPAFRTNVKYEQYYIYLYSLNNDSNGNIKTVGANSEYKLEAGEYVVMLARASEEENYRYNKYTEGTIIKPNFKLSGSNDPKKIIENNPSVFLKNVGEVEDAEVANLIYNLTYASNSLGNSKTLEVRELAQTTFPRNGTQYCYWYLNNVDENGNYTLFNRGVLSYTLQSGEYFAITAPDQVNLKVFSEGTKITRETGDTAWSVTPRDIQTLNVRNVDSLNLSKMFNFNNTDDINLTLLETQIIDIPEQSIVEIALDCDNIDEKSDIVFKHNGIFYKHLNEVSDTELTNVKIHQLSYHEKNSTEIRTVSNILSTGYDWEIKSLLMLMISNDNPQILYDNQFIEYKIEGENTKRCVSGTYEGLYVTTNALVMHDGTYELSTKSVGDDGNDMFLSMYAYNKISSTEDSITDMDGYTSLTFNNVVTEDTLTLDEFNNSVDIAHILSVSDLRSFYITLTYNGTEYNCMVVDNFISLENYSDTIDGKIDIGKIDVDQKTLILNITPDNSEITIKYIRIPEEDNSGILKYTYSTVFDLPQGNYVFPIIGGDATLGELTVNLCLIKGNTSEIINSQTFDLSKVNRSYYRFEIQDSVDKSYQFQFALKSAQISKSLTLDATVTQYVNLDKLFFYDEVAIPENFYSSDSEDLFNELERIDVNKKFNYIYNPSSVNVIIDPLDARSFNNSEHIMNSYTINKISDINIKIQNTSR